MRSEVRALDDETLGGLDDSQAELRFDDCGDHVSAVRRQGAMRMTFVRATLATGLYHASPGLLACVRTGMLSGMPVYQISVLGAATVLDEKHMAPARALQEEREQPSECTTMPNHCIFGCVVGSSRHHQTSIMNQTQPSSTVP